MKRNTAKNDITGDSLTSKTSKAYRDNYDAIFNKPTKEKKLFIGGILSSYLSYA